LKIKKGVNMTMFKKLMLIVAALFVSVGANAGDTGLEGKDVSAYLNGGYVDVDTAKTKLTDAGFEVLASYEPVKKGTTLVFTNSALKAEGAKPKRSHAAILRLFIDEQEKSISFTNPVYFGKAFMQDDYNHAVFNAQSEAINKAFPGLEGSKDKMPFDDLEDFHFMFGMPYYHEVDELSEGSNSELLESVKSYKKGKLVVFELKLSDKTTLVGYELGNRTKKFIDKIGRANAAVLPYCVSIEDGAATAMAAKYYLAVSYPLLTMGEFMTISTVPGAIKQDLSKAFKQVRDVAPVEGVKTAR
jgi:hypothetical protein